MTSSSQSQSPRSARPVRRGSERGAAVFVVVLVVTLLSALGLFAVRSASMTNVTSGYNRQMTQTHYLTDYAVLLMAAELGGEARQNYADEVKTGIHKDECDALSTVSLGTCFPVYYADLERRVQSYDSTNELLIPMSGGGTVPGSLGHADLEGDFRIEITDYQPAKPPIPGMSLTGLAPMPGYFNMTVTATGQVRPRAADPTKCDVVSRGAAGVESSRAHLIVGPLAP